MVDLNGHFLMSPFFHPYAPSNHTPTLSSCYRKHENLKKREYELRIREVKPASFTPIVLSSTGGNGHPSPQLSSPQREAMGILHPNCPLLNGRQWASFTSIVLSSTGGNGHPSPQLSSPQREAWATWPLLTTGHNVQSDHGVASLPSILFPLAIVHTVHQRSTIKSRTPPSLY